MEPTRTLQKHRPIAAYKRNTNLLDTLVCSKIKSTPPKSRGKAHKHLNTKDGFKIRLTNRFTPPSKICLPKCLTAFI